MSNLSVAKTNSAVDELGNLVIKGIVAGDQPGSVTIVIDHESVIGDAVAGGHRYGFFPIGNSAQRIVEYRDSVIPHLPAPRPPPPPLAPGSQKVAPAPTPGPTQIRLLIVYTKKSSSLFKDINAPISLALDDIKTTMSASNTNASIVSVGVSSSDYSEDGKTSSQILNDLQSGVGEFAKVHKLRNEKGADLVSVWADFSDACGLGYENDAIDSGTDGAEHYSAWGFSVLSTHYDTQCTPDLPHEVGHNMGAAHDRYVEPGNVPGPKGYNYGYVDLKGKFRDTMAYEDQCKAAGFSCPRKQYYSNPNVTLDGRPMGESDSLPDAADAARRIRELAPYVAQFHQFLGP